MRIVTEAAAWAPAMAPTASSPQDQDGIRFLLDRHYALHGEVMMVVVILLFAAFIFCLLVFPCLRRAKNRHLLSSLDEDSDVVGKPSSCFSSWFMKRRTDGDGASSTELSLRRETRSSEMRMVTEAAAWAPAMAPTASSPQDQDGIRYLLDRHYALHGEVMMVVVILLFAAFIFCLLVFPRLRQAKNRHLRSSLDEDSDVVGKPSSCFSSWFMKRRTDGDGASSTELPLRRYISSEVTRNTSS
ncbi:unnamed protein product [Malus baccata var. baccata]